MDDFSDAPVSVGELRADKANSGCAWKPRDALISLLRRIDKGEINPETLVVCWREETGRFGWETASPLFVISLGLMTECMAKMASPERPPR